MSFRIAKYDVQIQLTQDLLGTVPKDRAVYANYIADKSKAAADRVAKRGGVMTNGQPHSKEAMDLKLAEELESVAETEERGWTTFHCDPKTGQPFLLDYMVRGFLCESARTMREHGKIKQLHDKFCRHVFVFPRCILLPEIAGVNERSLRASTPMGQRVTLVRSDFVKAGALIDFKIHVFETVGVKLKRDLLLDVMSYGAYKGLGQWRTGSHGRFDVLKFDLTQGQEPQDEEEAIPEAPKRGRKPGKPRLAQMPDLVAA